MSDTSLPNGTPQVVVQLSSDRMLVNILTITAVSLVIIAVAVALPGDNPMAVMLLILCALITAIGIILTRRGIDTPGRILVPSLLTFVIAFIAYNRGGLYHIAIAGYPVVIILAGLLMGTRGAFVFAFLASVATTAIGYADLTGISPFAGTTRVGWDDLIVAAALFFTTAGLLQVIIRRMSIGLRESQANALAQEQAKLELLGLQKDLEGRVQQRTSELEERISQQQTIAQVSRIISGIQNLDELLSKVAGLISERFLIYHTGIFLLDVQGEFAVLRAASSQGGKEMLERGHRLKVGAQGIVGNVTATGRPRIALDVGADAVYFDNPYLPDTRSEIALPLIVADQVIGALDLQSTQSGAFEEADIQTLSILADQVAIAIQNARLFEESRQAIEEVETAYRQMTGQAWAEALENIQVSGFEFDGTTPKPVAQITIDEGALTIPLILRGQTIGNLVLSGPEADHKWTDDELALAQAAADRTALALENARLLEDAQRRANKERTISEGSARVSTALDIESILRITAEELERALGSSDLVIQLESEE